MIAKLDSFPPAISANVNIFFMNNCSSVIVVTDKLLFAQHRANEWKVTVRNCNRASDTTRRWRYVNRFNQEIVLALQDASILTHFLRDTNQKRAFALWSPWMWQKYKKNPMQHGQYSFLVNYYFRLHYIKVCSFFPIISLCCVYARILIIIKILWLNIIIIAHTRVVHMYSVAWVT